MNIENQFIKFHAHDRLMPGPGRRHHIGSPTHADHGRGASRAKHMGERGNIVVKVAKILELIGVLGHIGGSATINANHLVGTRGCLFWWNAMTDGPKRWFSQTGRRHGYSRVGIPSHALEIFELFPVALGVKRAKGRIPHARIGGAKSEEDDSRAKPWNTPGASCDAKRHSGHGRDSAGQNYRTRRIDTREKKNDEGAAEPRPQ